MIKLVRVYCSELPIVIILKFIFLATTISIGE